MIDGHLHIMRDIITSSSCAITLPTQISSAAMNNGELTAVTGNVGDHGDLPPELVELHRLLVDVLRLQLEEGVDVSDLGL